MSIIRLQSVQQYQYTVVLAVLLVAALLPTYRLPVRGFAFALSYRKNLKDCLEQLLLLVLHLANRPPRTAYSTHNLQPIWHQNSGQNTVSTWRKHATTRYTRYADSSLSRPPFHQGCRLNQMDLLYFKYMFALLHQKSDSSDGRMSSTTCPSFATPLQL